MDTTLVSPRDSLDIDQKQLEELKAEREKRKLEILIEEQKDKEEAEKRAAAREFRRQQSGISLLSPRFRPALARSDDTISNNNNTMKVTNNNNDDESSSSSSATTTSNSITSPSSTTDSYSTTNTTSTTTSTTNEKELLSSDLSTTSTSSASSASSSIAIPKYKIELNQEKKKSQQTIAQKIDSSHSFLSPSFIQTINNPEVKNILIAGCGGGFDFTHGMLIYPELKKLKKNIIIGSYSFGSTENLKNAELVWEQKSTSNGTSCQVKKVTSSSEGHYRYCPEYRMALYLDECFPKEAPHFIYAYNARLFSVPMLSDLYNYFVKTHDIDTIIIIDGGTDSLMKGDEYGLGDPVEDCVSMTTVALLMNEGKIKNSLLLSVGFGMDRFNNVSDSESLKAISELTQMGGFLGSMSIEKTSTGFQFYKNCIEYINNGQSFRSVMSHGIISATEGNFGFLVPKEIEKRVKDEKGVYLWPLTSMIWAFDPQIMMKRSLLSSWIKDCNTPFECSCKIDEERSKLRMKGELRDICNIPTHNEILDRRFANQLTTLTTKAIPMEPLFIQSNSFLNGRVLIPLFFLGGYFYDLYYRNR